MCSITGFLIFCFLQLLFNLVPPTRSAASPPLPRPPDEDDLSLPAMTQGIMMK